MNIAILTTQDEAEKAFIRFIMDEVTREPYCLEYKDAIARFCRYIPSDWQSIIKDLYYDEFGQKFYRKIESNVWSEGLLTFTPRYFELKDKKDALDNPVPYVYVPTNPGQYFGGVGLVSKFPKLALNKAVRGIATAMSHLVPNIEYANTVVEKSNGQISIEDIKTSLRTMSKFETLLEKGIIQITKNESGA